MLHLLGRRAVVSLVPFVLTAGTVPAAAQRGARPAAPAASSIHGGYDAVRYNGKALPAQDRFPGKQGLAHVARLEEMYVILRPGGKFVAGGRYALDYRAAGDRSALPRPADETTKGTWTRQGNAITFRPDPPKNRRPVRPIGGVVTASGLTVNYQVQTQAGTRTLRLEFVRNPNLLY